MANREEEVCRAREVENDQRLGKLPQEVWEKIFDHLGNDLFPLALSCRYFRQKQKELVERTEQSGKPCLTLKTNLKRKLDEGQPASAEYLRLCSDLAIYDLQTYINSDNHEDTDKAEEACTRSMLVACLAAVYGHLPLLQDHFSEDGPCYINQRGFQIFGPAIAKNAAFGGQLEVLQWVRRTAIMPFTGGYAYTAAAAGGHLEILKWLRSVGYPWDEKAMATGSSAIYSQAAGGGHLEILKWLRSEGCPWDARACLCAARYGRLEILKWLRSEGCPWNEQTWMWAAESTREWLTENNCPRYFRRGE